MRNTSRALAAIGLLVLGCDSSTTSSPTDGTPTFLSGSTVVHRVTASGPDVDFVGPGGDATFSLVGILRSDGSASGQYTDQYGHANGGLHAVLDCVHVVGNEAWVSGTITSGNIAGGVGLPVTLHLVDNGQSANDPPDQISFANVGNSTLCTDEPVLDLFDMTNGEVRVQ